MIAHNVAVFPSCHALSPARRSCFSFLQIMSQFHRLPGFPSSYFGLDIITVLAWPVHQPRILVHSRTRTRCIARLESNLSSYHSMPSLKSCCFQGNDSRIGFEDTLNDPYMSPEQPHTHKTMEQVSFACLLRFSFHSLIVTANFISSPAGRFSSYPLSSAMVPATPIPFPTSTRFDRANKPQTAFLPCTNRFYNVYCVKFNRAGRHEVLASSIATEMKERMASFNPCRQALSDSKATRHPQFEQHRRLHGLSIVLRLRAQLHHATIINQM